MVQKNYLIQAHTHPEQLCRLIQALNDGHSFFYVHIDRRVDQDSFTRLIQGEKVKFIDQRVDCIWGDFSLVMATIHLMEQVVRDNRKGYVIFLSGQDYPIRSNAEINAFISRNQDYNFLDLKPIDQVWPSFRLRTDYYKFNVSSRRGDFVMYRPFHPASLVKAVYGYTRGKIDLSAFRLLMKKRQLRVIRNLFGGSQWFALNHETLLRLCAFIEEHREELFSHFQYTFCADEIFVHSILGHLSAQISDIRFGPSLTYVNWNGRNGEYPVTFELSDREEILSQPEGKLFARKFDAMRCPHILDALDEHRT